MKGCERNGYERDAWRVGPVDARRKQEETGCHSEAQYADDDNVDSEAAYTNRAPQYVEEVDKPREQADEQHLRNTLGAEGAASEEARDKTEQDRKDAEAEEESHGVILAATV